MIKRTIEISGPQISVCVRMGQLVISRKDEELGRVPAEDIGVCVIDTATAQYTHSTMTEIARNGGLIVLCGDDHCPAAMVTPVAGNHLLARRLALQAEAPKPLNKRLWQQIVKAKIKNQAAATEDAEVAERLRGMAGRVRSGDANNMESQAARLYWQRWLGDTPFRRGRNGEPPNHFLNYGYMVLRAAVTRAIAGSGLHPALGLHHANRFDAFCLADDLMEPFRPLVDLRARAMHRGGEIDINAETKPRLLSVLTAPCRLKDETGPLQVMLERLLASLVHCYEGKRKTLAIPVPDLSPETGEF